MEMETEMETLNPTVDLCSQLMQRYSTSPAPQHRHLIATAAAMKSVIQQDSLPLSPLSYFAASMSSLSTTINTNDDSNTSLATLLSISLPLVPHGSVSPDKAAEAANVLVTLVGSTSSSKCIVKCLGLLLSFSDSSSTWDSLRLPFQTLLNCSIHHRPKVRKCALFYLQNAFHSFKSPIVKEKSSQLILSSLLNSISTSHKLPLFKNPLHRPECHTIHHPNFSHIISVLAVVRVLLPYLSDQVCIQVVNKLVHLLDARSSALTSLILAAIDAFFHKPDIQLISPLPEDIVDALSLYVSSKSNSTDTLILAANLLKTALDKMHSGDIAKWHNCFPSVVKAIGGLLTCEDDIASASSNILKKLIDDQLVDFESHQAILAVNVEPESNAIAAICSDFMRLLESFAHIPSEHILAVLSVLFLKLGRNSSIYMKRIILKLSKMIITAIENEYDTSHLQKCFGCAVVSFGAEDILTLVPIVFNAENLTCSNMWLLPILKKYTFGASLTYFMDNIVPVAKSLKKAARKVKKTVTGKDLQAHAHGLWSLLPTFCRHPTDISESFQPLSKLMLSQLKKDAARHEDVAKALQELVRRNKCPPKCDAAIAESPERSSDILLEDDLMEERGLVPFSKKDANRNIKALSSQSKELLQALLTVFLDSPPEKRSMLKKAISCLASISKSSRAKKIFILSLERFPLVKAVLESGDLSDASQNDLTSIKVNDESQWSLSLDLASSFVEGADEDFLGLIFRLAKHSFQAKDEIVVREAYCTLSCILKDNPTFCFSKFDELVDLMSHLESPADIGSFRNRLSCLRTLLVSVLKTSSDVENTKPFQILNYIILALKDSKEDARKIAYDELLQIGSCLEELSSANSCELYNKLISMILAYLSGSSPHITSAAVSALSVLVFKEPELCVRVPELIPSVTSLLQTKAVEVIKAVLGFIKVLVSCLEGKDLHNFLSIIMDGLLPWSSVSRHHFRSKVTVIIEILIRKCGFPAVKLVTPERYQPFIKKVSLNRQGKSISKEDDSVDMMQPDSDVSTIGSKKRMRNESRNKESGSRSNLQKRQKQGQGSHNNEGSRFNREKSRNQGQGSYPPRKVEGTDFRSSRKPNQLNQKKAGYSRKSEKPKMNRGKAFGGPRQNGPRNKQR